MTRPARKAAPAPLHYRSVAVTHAGARPLNEDRYLERPEAGLWAVADGMGGHQAGDVAAEHVVEALSRIEPSASGYAFLKAATDTLTKVNTALIEQAAATTHGGVIGATVVAMLVHDRHYACLWAGDSRAYLCRGGQLVRITQDHSLVQEMVDAGALTAAQSRTHRQANVVTRAVGVAEPLTLDVLHAPIESGDVFLLCSDGLTGAVEDVEIETALRTGALEPAAAALLHLALERGAPDNVTLVLVRAD